MQTGSQLTLYANRSQRHGQRSVVDWILDTAHETGVRGATVVEGSEGVDVHGRMHAARFFELADEPAVVVVVAEDVAIDTLLAKLAQSGEKLFYTRSRVEFGRLGDAG
jgi:PII-like signaling protein